MAIDRIEKILAHELEEAGSQGTLKGQEQVITGLLPGDGAEGPRYLLAGEGDRRFLRMNSNSYLGMSLVKEVVEAEEKAARTFGTGPGAVRFISGTYQPHIELERRLAEFHGREACMIFSSAYATSMGVLPPLITADTAVVSDELNHNCIINAMRLARPREKKIYRHLDLKELDNQLAEAAGSCPKSWRLPVSTTTAFPKMSW
jgi:glycine C-acetyltransferase